MFRETIHHAGGVTEGTASEAHALYLLRRAARRGYDIEVTKAGGALITWTARLFGRRDGEVIEEARSIELAPHLPVGAALTDATVRDLTDIHEARRPCYADENGRRVISLNGFCRIPPAATARLRARGLVAEDGDGRVRLTLTARLGLLARAHRTRTTEPRGWHYPADIGMASAGLCKPGRRSGLLYDRGSAAVCSCGQIAAYGDGRDEARRRAADHRREITRAFILADLTPSAS
ncbi:hypothetical protein ABZ820_12655 [Streptomyces diacarni]|uniref:hypothetical protein n=1 Tax=Streptomyces diacarni TaxID=2800381 RepID=UPI0033FCFE96